MTGKPFAYAWRWKGGATWKLTLTKKPNHHPDIEIKELFDRRASAAPADLTAALDEVKRQAWNEGIEALAAKLADMLRACAEANAKTDRQYAEEMREWADDVLAEASALRRDGGK